MAAGERTLLNRVRMDDMPPPAAYVAIDPVAWSRAAGTVAVRRAESRRSFREQLSHHPLLRVLVRCGVVLHR